MGSFTFSFKFHWSLFLKVHIYISSGNNLVPNRQQVVTWTNVDPYLRCPIPALGRNESYYGISLAIFNLLSDLCFTNFGYWYITVQNLSWSCLLLDDYTSLTVFQYLIHPSLGWLYVFSMCPAPRPRPRPPQWLLLLTSKPFEPDLRYLGQRKYRSGKMYWMTFGWPWPKVTPATLINKNLLICRIKWEPLNQSLQNLVAIFLWSWS